ncbi:tRNA 2-selenouridine(34) synthase MnmH [Sphaerothrix gracilis]|uniref:tRNA 2-selenouridine(34) synthase MnmH n=1 Tax=Sphaerothrix gracilis TaxID=3151835 RepID=UPI0031FD0116
MSVSLTAPEFLAAPEVLLDVRSPSEYAQGHIPGAISFPLFSDWERSQVGTCYKQIGREAAVELGFELVGPKIASFIRQAKGLAPDRRVKLHCWRGGMRSESLAWALQMGGFEVMTLEGGYKSFRRWVRTTLSTPKSIIVLGGMTGTSKTDILQALAEQGSQVLDLEGHANHRGSSYGALGMPPQPSTEQFENLVALDWAKFEASEPVWIEAESRRVGTCRVPDELFAQMEAAPTLAVTRPLEERLDYLVEIYGSADTAGLVEATERIRKRLGGQRTQAAIAHIEAGRLHEALKILLTYYDRAYTYDLERRHKQIPTVEIGGLSAIAAAQKLQVEAQRLFQLSPTAFSLA